MVLPEEKFKARKNDTCQQCGSEYHILCNKGFPTAQPKPEGECPIRVLDISRKDDYRMCLGKNGHCEHALLKSETICPCCSPASTEEWDDAMAQIKEIGNDIDLPDEKWAEKYGYVQFWHPIETVIKRLLSSHDQQLRQRIVEEAEKIIQKERFAGAPAALNKLITFITNLK